MNDYRNYKRPYAPTWRQGTGEVKVKLKCQCIFEPNFVSRRSLKVFQVAAFHQTFYLVAHTMPESLCIGKWRFKVLVLHFIEHPDYKPKVSNTDI